MAISPQQLKFYLTSAHRAVIFAIAQLSCLLNEGGKEGLFLLLTPWTANGFKGVFEKVKVDFLIFRHPWSHVQCGVQTVGRKASWAKDVWATKACSLHSC